jgi:iron complex transport system substrate-binding protein
VPRVVSLLPAATEIVAALGATESLVGVTHECDSPPAVRHLPRVTAATIDAFAAAGAIDAEVRRQSAVEAPLFALLADRIAELGGDVLVTQALCDVCAVSEQDVRALAADLVPTPAVVTLSGSTLDGVFADVSRVADALGAPERGAELLSSLRGRMRRLHETLAAARAPRPRVAVIEWTEPVFAAGHWVPEMVRRAGGCDVLAAVGEHSATRTLEELHAAAPDVVLISPCGYSAARAAEEGRRLLARDDWRWARGRSVWALDANGLVSRPGPRLVRGIEVMAAIFNPALFPRPDAEEAFELTALTS